VINAALFVTADALANGDKVDVVASTLASSETEHLARLTVEI
jgi:hypothetical protein